MLQDALHAQPGQQASAVWRAGLLLLLLSVGTRAADSAGAGHALAFSDTTVVLKGLKARLCRPVSAWGSVGAPSLRLGQAVGPVTAVRP